MAFIDSGKTFDKEKHQRKMKRLLENMDRTKCTIRIPTNIFKKFRRKLLEKGSNANEFLNDMILKYIEKE